MVLNNYSIEIYVGEKRSGKTLSMVYDTWNDRKQDKNVKIFSNIKLNEKYFKDYNYISKHDLENFFKNKEEFKDSIFLIDETHIFLDSRRFAKEGNLKIGYFLGQMGKRNNVFRGTTHFPHLLDFRLRCYCERWLYIRKGLVYNGTFMPVTNNNTKLNVNENKKLFIQIKGVIRKLIDFEFYYVNEDIKYLKAALVFDMYDTEELLVDND